MANLNASSLTIATIPIMKEFHVSKTRAGYTTCLNVLLFGFGNLLWVPLSRVIGMRPMYLAAILLLVVSNIWSVEAKSFNSLLVSRIVSGLAASAGDAPVPAVVASMFLPSHRGRYLVVFQLSLTAGIFFSPLICGLCVQYRTWRWTCGFITIANAIVFLLALCNIRETRPYRLTGRAPNIWRRTIAAVAPIVADPSQRDSGLRLLRSILSLSIRPQILWASFTIGTFVGWYVQSWRQKTRLNGVQGADSYRRIIIIMISSGSTFSRPPYGWDTQIIGVFSMSGFVGALAAYFSAGKLIDHVSNRLTKPGTERRPEYRLPLIVIPAVIGPMGLVVFGACVAHRLTWVGAAFGYGMQSFGLTAVSNIAITYAVDSYESVHLEFRGFGVAESPNANSMGIVRR